MRKYLRNFHLEYMNDFLSEQAFAAYLGADEARVSRMLAIGRKLNYRKPKMIQLKAHIGIDVACYATTFIEADKSLLQDEDALSKHITERLQTAYDDGDFLVEFEPDWCMRSNFRLVSAYDPKNNCVLADVPIERNYHDAGLEIAGQLMRDVDAPEWIINLARHYKLID